MQINTELNEFINEGYVVQNLENTNFLNNFKEIILETLKGITNNKDITLETFHKFVKDDKEKLEIQYLISKKIWDEKLHFNLIKENIDLYYNIFGKDLDIQAKPHLRIARPNCPQDNIGFHRDSQYGNKAFELSNFFTFVDLDENSALQVEAKSHKRGTLPYTKIESASVKKGSMENQLGYLYAPKLIDETFKINANPIPLNFGQVLILGLGTIHGQETNSSNTTRWSIDIRVKNSFSTSNVKEGYYTNLTSSIVSKYAQEYYKACND
ncbi:hypothetical protein ACH5BF_11495 [Arcobacter sp. YIC-464]|uniref:hypothetical protein n=1 Tax=Arcobacter sp. YIC-464 TaxID=3376631 RepID=UPI003C244ED1